MGYKENGGTSFKGVFFCLFVVFLRLCLWRCCMFGVTCLWRCCMSGIAVSVVFLCLFVCLWRCCVCGVAVCLTLLCLWRCCVSDVAVSVALLCLWRLCLLGPVCWAMYVFVCLWSSVSLYVFVESFVCL